MLESIGLLTIIGIVIYLLIKNTESNTEKKYVDGEMIENSYSCQKLIREFNKSLSTGKPLMSNEMLKKKLREIIKDPQEKKQIAERILNRENQLKKDEEDKLRRVKVGYKYDEQIFEIFDNNRELSKTQLLQSIKEKFRFNNLEESENLFGIWDKNWLIYRCDWNSANWEIGFINSRHSKTANDITYDDWLKERNIILKPESNESKEYFKDELPF